MPLPRESFAFGLDAQTADELAALVLAGRKRATTSLLAEYEAEGQPRPAAGDRSVILDGGGDPVCVIETARVDVRRFDDVDTEFARVEGEGEGEGEGDGSLGHWREVHRDALGATCDALGMAFTLDLAVVCERFEVVWAPTPAPEQSP
ncbi:ASCH domain-containing protein [Egibacter rhizosphaerae]|uniref:ASCH domain-containing protein n=1 Tax=Egibacter rhizosphaerae TaxID=1670831 RepID=A0A411YEI8_9ACTN|nr:ASCH domain-containing protein [Egibacter rhizosphaerae]QBI19674.1 ASCH domain-containing protein [Egibacter rhizosphaerae]